MLSKSWCRSLTSRTKSSAARRAHTRFGVENLENRHLLAADLVISEVVASNDTGLEDEDMSHPDWFELFNAGDEAADLNGWYVTDDAMDLTKWQFPSTTVEPGEFLVVFASDKDRAESGAELHTNFKLSSGGEYLAIVDADGSTIVTEITFEQQYTDISFGPEQKDFVYDYVPSGSSAKVLIPTSDAQDGSWTSLAFDDGSWAIQDMGIGFDDGGELDSLISANGDVSEMRGTNASAYLRSTFTIDGDVPDLDILRLDVNFDDGFVAYLNGTEVARENAPGVASWNSSATQDNSGILADFSYEDFADEAVQEQFQVNGSADWSEGAARISRSAPFQTGSTFLKEPVPFGGDYSFSTSMKLDAYATGGFTSDADGKGGQGMTFVLQSGGPFQLGAKEGGLGLEDLGASFVAIELDSFATGAFDPDGDLPSHIGINTSGEGNVARVAVPRFNDGSRGESPVYLWVDYNGITEQMDVFFSQTESKPATATLSTSVDLNAIFQGAPSLWPGWTAATNLAWNAHEVVSWQMQTQSSELGLSTQSFDILEHESVLQSGENVLAIHGMNVDANDGDFLISSSLYAAEKDVLFRDSVKYFIEPTPGASNGQGSEPPTAQVEFSTTGRVIAESFMLELSAPAENAEIRYTTDGTIPTELSPVYTGPIEISETSRVRAVAIEDGFAPSIPRTESFVMIGEQLTSFEGGVFESNLPIVVLDSFGDSQINNDASRMGAAAAIFIDVNEETGMASLLDEPDEAVQAGVRIRGQSSQGWPKKQYALEAWDEGLDYGGGRIPAAEGPDRNISPLGLPRESDWVLNGPYSDKTQLNNHTAFGLYNELGLYSPRTKLVEVFVNSGSGPMDYNSDYRGTYILVEKIKIDNNRVDLPPAKFDPAPDADPRTVGGYIFKQDKDGAGDVNFRANSGGPSINFKFVDPDSPNEAQETWLTDFVNKAESVLYGDNWLDPDEGYRKYYDTDSLIDHWLITELAKEIDGFRLSEYFILNSDGKIAKGPAWDFNLSFSNGNYLQGGKWEGWYHTGIGGAQYHWYPRLFDDPSFEAEVAERWFDLRQTTFSKEFLFETIDNSVNMLTNGSPNYDNPTPEEGSNPISRNYDRWGTVSSYLWPNCFFNGNSPANECRPSPLPPEMSADGQPNSYDDYVFIMKDFVENRLSWIDSQFGSPIDFDPPGGAVDVGTQVAISTDAPGTLYYTLDGSDPQQPQVVFDLDVIAPAGGALNYVVPTDSTLIDACKSTGISLRNPEQCFINPDYVMGTHGETWVEGNSGIGFGYDGLNTDVQSDVQGVNSTVYLKIPFEVTQEQKDNWDGVGLNVKYDDGFVAYLWFNSLRLPVEVTRTNVAGSSPAFPIRTAAFDAAAETDRDDVEAESYELIDITNRRQYLNVGENFLVVQLANNDVSDASMFFDVEVVALTERVVLPDNVIPYSDPITIDGNTVINTRTYDPETDEWGSRRRESYFTSVPPIIVSEIMYNPADPTASEIAAGYDDNDVFEYVEIMNIGSEVYDLEGVRFFEAIEFGFTAGASLEGGERGVIVRDQEAFEERYGTELNVLGTWADPVDKIFSRNLSNTGERIVLEGAVTEPLLDFEYSDAWYPLTDGAGYSLTIVDPNASRSAWNEASNWRVSDSLGGSPGTGDLGVAPAAGSILINELTANSTSGDAIELRNLTDAAIDVSNFFVTDDANDWEKYQVAAGTTLPADGYLVLDSSNVTGGFSLADTGGRIVFQAATAAGDYLGFQTARNYDAADVDVTEGVFTNSLGNVDFVPLSSSTLGAENSAPTIGPLVVNEIMYNPATGGTEWVELRNVSSELIELGSDGWGIAEAFDYTFPSGASVEPFGYVLLIQGDDGVDHVTTINEFKALNSVPGEAEVYVYEPGIHGSLSNNGEDLSVGRRVSVGDVTGVIKTELVEYDNNLPWAVDADGTGKSLSRVSATSYGNEPSNWIAGPVGGTPGGANPGGPVTDLNGDGTLDVADVNVIYDAINNGGNPGADLDGSGTVDFDDVNSWLESAGNASVGTPFVAGDANLDGRVDVQDLNRVGINWLLEGVEGWGQGDFNADGSVNSVDLNQVGINWQRGVARAPRAPLAAMAVVDAEFRRSIDFGSNDLDEISDDVAELEFDGSAEIAVGDHAMRRRATSLRRQLRSSLPTEAGILEPSFVEMADDVFAGW